MNMSFDESINFCKDNSNALGLLSDAAEIVICPSFVALAPIVGLLQNSSITVGAQNCSEHKSGAYTGEISAQSLAQVGVTHCIVGHSEQRMYHHETTEQIVNKMQLLYTNNITPIICIGETEKDYLNNQTFTVLTQQLKPILPYYAKATKGSPEYRRNHIIIAYEPIWSIGTGIVPEQKQLHDIFTWLTDLLRTQLPNYTAQLLYGGSVNQDNIAELKKIPPINGFLIGGASTEFNQFKNIITD